MLDTLGGSERVNANNRRERIERVRSARSAGLRIEMFHTFQLRLKGAGTGRCELFDERWMLSVCDNGGRRDRFGDAYGSTSR